MSIQPLISRVPDQPGPSDRMQFHKYPPALPGKCIICQKTSNGAVSFLDINWSIDDYGAVYFCTDCLTPLAHAIGFVETKSLMDAEREAAELAYALREVEDERDHYRSIVNSLRAVRPDLAGDDFKPGQNKKSDDSGLETDSKDSGDDNRNTSESAPSK